MNEKILGVIGGLGPLATAYFMEETAAMTQAVTDQDHLNMIVYNFPSIPDRTGYILGSNLRSPLPGLLWVGNALAREEVSAIAIPCVTAHYFYEELASQLRVPILHALRETARHLKDQGVTSAGILATEGTVFSGIFSLALSQQGIRPFLPSPACQEDVNHLIYQNVKKGLPAEMDRFHRAAGELRQKGAEVILLGCTELSMIRRQEALGPGYLDTLQVLARASILSCGKEIKPEYQNLLTR